MIDTILIFQKKEITVPACFTEQITKSIEGTKNKFYYNHPVARITYYPKDQRLLAESSLPKLLYQSNIPFINENEINQAKSILNEWISDITKSNLKKENWKASKIDYYYNFKVDTQVSSYLEYFSFLKLPYKGIPIIWLNETVTWKSTTEGLKFYDKFIESKENPAAKGILRMELRLMRHKTMKRRTGLDEVFLDDMINEDLYLEIMNEYLEKVFSYKKKIKTDTELFSILREKFKLNKAVEIYGWMKMIKSNGIKFLETLPKSTYYDIRKKLADEGLSLVMDQVEPLKIER